MQRRFKWTSLDKIFSFGKEFISNGYAVTKVDESLFPEQPYGFTKHKGIICLKKKKQQHSSPTSKLRYLQWH